MVQTIDVETDRSGREDAPRDRAWPGREEIKAAWKKYNRGWVTDSRTRAGFEAGYLAAFAAYSNPDGA